MMKRWGKFSIFEVSRRCTAMREKAKDLWVPQNQNRYLMMRPKYGCLGGRNYEL